jgi:hypothetical protein
MNVPSDGVILISEYETSRGANLVEVFNRIDTDERAGGTILFARIRFAFCACWIE